MATADALGWGGVGQSAPVAAAPGRVRAQLPLERAHDGDTARAGGPAGRAGGRNLGGGGGISGAEPRAVWRLQAERVRGRLHRHAGGQSAARLRPRLADAGTHPALGVCARNARQRALEAAAASSVRYSPTKTTLLCVPDVQPSPHPQKRATPLSDPPEGWRPAGTKEYKSRALQTPFASEDPTGPNGGNATVSITLEQETDVRFPPPPV